MRPPQSVAHRLKDALPQGFSESMLRTGNILTVALGATCLLYCSYTPHDSDIRTSYQEAQNCDDITTTEGSTIGDVLTTHLKTHPTIDGFHTLESFVDYSTTHSIEPTRQLPEAVFTVCLSPDGTKITSIDSTIEPIS
jgi:hypothetical protein